ncbi:hypothetical protein [Nonomuraea cavernae]|nr:hypothetical protein [Nonomuraea cavernae]MCA2183715.1 hypothetical protein [Nonomuraea cavernae]
MKGIVVSGVGLLAILGMVVGFTRDGSEPREVSEDQYHVLMEQCRYADTSARQAECRAAVKEGYRVGKVADPTLDCRTYVGVTVCGELTLSDAEQKCVRHSVDEGLPYRRAEVECYVAA